MSHAQNIHNAPNTTTLVLKPAQAAALAKLIHQQAAAYAEAEGGPMGEGSLHASSTPFTARDLRRLLPLLATMREAGGGRARD